MNDVSEQFLRALSPLEHVADEVTSDENVWACSSSVVVSWTGPRRGCATARGLRRGW
jgi:hypothetical protein